MWPRLDTHDAAVDCGTRSVRTKSECWTDQCLYMIVAKLFIRLDEVIVDTANKPTRTVQYILATTEVVAGPVLSEAFADRARTDIQSDEAASAHGCRSLVWEGLQWPHTDWKILLVAEMYAQSEIRQDAPPCCRRYCRSSVSILVLRQLKASMKCTRIWLLLTADRSLSYVRCGSSPHARHVSWHKRRHSHEVLAGK